ncbi:DUF6412 domain-containing protein [Ornithinicoccus hortensis]|uniref:Uncharacterized protein n=1 Tax=Ornithinicoccus hortensis TaxID=82346 RepID=A0A542YP22_9MICO|nr:DUF6412 domain-containing protein [Ornithinicoccus hortensis]TQL49846.1 hypothetical protein FB467_0940 [Ornithinicoccus hortensis]
MTTLERAYARSVLAVLLGALLGSLLVWSGDPASLVLSVGVVLLTGMLRRSAAAPSWRAGLVRSDGVGRRRYAWSRLPLPLRDPGLPGRPQPRAPGLLTVGVPA